MAVLVLAGAAVLFVAAVLALVALATALAGPAIDRAVTLPDERGGTLEAVQDTGDGA